jgi:hypothetical protein
MKQRNKCCGPQSIFFFFAFLILIFADSCNLMLIKWEFGGKLGMGLGLSGCIISAIRYKKEKIHHHATNSVCCIAY